MCYDDASLNIKGSRLLKKHTPNQQVEIVKPTQVLGRSFKLGCGGLNLTNIEIFY